MASSSNRTRVVLGDEYDDNLRGTLLDTLREFGAHAIDHCRGVGGSQDIERLEIKIDAEIIVIEAETYVGLSIEGNERMVNRIAARVRQRMAT